MRELSLRIYTMTLMQGWMRSVEEMIERSITDAEQRGVMIVGNLDANGETVVGFRLDADVPYGHVFEFSSEEAVAEWRARGCPT